MTAAAVLSYSIIIGDSFAAVAQLCNAPAALASSNAWIVLMSGFVLLPLSLMRDMSRLAIGSVIGTCGTLYTVLFVWLRLLDGSYFAGGRFFEMLPLAGQPAFASPTLARPLLNPGIFVLLSMLPSAFGAHFNAARFYSDLAEPADGSSKLSTFHRVCAAGFGFAGLLTAAVMSGGFFTFGSAAKGLILNNYATADPLALLARVGIGVSMVFSYPLVFTGLRDGVLAMLKKEEAGQKPLVHVGLTVAMLALLNGTSLVVKDLGLVVALGGAILGSATVYILPALMIIFTKKCTVPKAEKVVNALLAILGVFFAGVGTRMCFV
jgi:sodium-coupled neutral amino acid transporter 11